MSITESTTARKMWTNVFIISGRQVLFMTPNPGYVKSRFLKC